jgi:hypothetical protein
VRRQSRFDIAHSSLPSSLKLSGISAGSTKPCSTARACANSVYRASSALVSLPAIDFSANCRNSSGRFGADAGAGLSVASLASLAS